MTEGKTDSILQGIADLSRGEASSSQDSGADTTTGAGDSSSSSSTEEGTPSSGMDAQPGTPAQPGPPALSQLNAGGGGVLPMLGQPGSGSSSAPEEGKKGDDAGRVGGMPFSAPATRPTQEGAHGLRYDFNFGIRVLLPKGEQWRARFWDQDTETCLHESSGGDEFVCSRKKYFIRGLIELFKDGELVWTHEYDARGKKVAILMPVGTLGDPLGWVPYAVRFGEEHECELTIVASKAIIDLMGPAYPDVNFIEEKDFEALREGFYATYYIGLFFRDEGQEWQPRDFRAVGLHRTAGWILGVEDKTEIRPRVQVEDPDTRPIEEPYVVVAVQASCACKMWHNPFGWLDTVVYLKKMGYRVICIDKDPVVGSGIHWNALPNGVEDETGARPLAERARWLKHAEFFVGLSSGLSWLAWAVDTPVVMISGFTDPYNEFHTPYRVFSTHGCNGCWHDVRTPFQHNDYLFCPRHKDTPRAFECTRIIGTAYVVATIKRLCRDYGYQPPAVRHGGPWPDDEEWRREMEETKAKRGAEFRHEFYWEL